MRDVALITGASRGIGAACARAFAAAGYTVAINYLHSDERAEALARELAAAGHTAKIYRADVADRAAVEAMARQVERDLGPVDALVLCAGHAGQGLFQSLTEAEIRRMFDVHCMGAVNPIQAVLPGMIARRHGSIVAVSSVYGIAGASCEGHYAAAKAAQIGLIKSLARECGPSGVRANAVAPGSNAASPWRQEYLDMRRAANQQFYYANYCTIGLALNQGTTASVYRAEDGAIMFLVLGTKDVAQCGWVRGAKAP